MDKPKHDISNRVDITALMNAFYSILLKNPSISYIFTDVAKMNMEEHLPVIVDFWEMVLFHKGSYQKNVMMIHQKLNDQTSFQKHHFNTWLTCFNSTIDSLFAGPVAEQAKQRALSIATIMQVKMSIPQK